MNQIATTTLDPADAAVEPDSDWALRDYERIAHVVRYLRDNMVQQPELAQLADIAGVTPGHLQRVFKRFAGVSPKRFLQHLTVSHAKQVLRDSASVMDAALDVGLSGPSRLHDHFVTLEAMTPGEYKRLGEALEIRYGLHASPFGRMFIGVTPRGVCAVHFLDSSDISDSVRRLAREWPGAMLIADAKACAPVAAQMFAVPPGDAPLSLLVRGTNFQIQVWRALLRIPSGRLRTYSAIAREIGQPRASRAVGRAVGANPVSLLIPCHRVIRADGVIGHYHWGPERKRAILGRELSLC